MHYCRFAQETRSVFFLILFQVNSFAALLDSYLIRTFVLPSATHAILSICKLFHQGQVSKHKYCSQTNRLFTTVFPKVSGTTP